jgi:hypothetical protein
MNSFGQAYESVIRDNLEKLTSFVNAFLFSLLKN